MYRYFKTMESVAKSDPREYTHIKDLCVDMMKDAGYSKCLVTLENGKKVEKIKYTKEFDSALTAKWFVHYKKVFGKVLFAHPELKDHFEDIITRTFTHMFRFMKIENIKSDKSVDSMLSLSLSNRIGEVLIQNGSEKRWASQQIKTDYEKEKGFKKSNERVSMNNAINVGCLDIDNLSHDDSENMLSKYSNDSSNLFLLDIKVALKDNPFGERVLETLLNSNGRVATTCIDKFIALKEEEKTEDTLMFIQDAYKTIVDVLYDTNSIPPMKMKRNIKIAFSSTECVR